MYDECPLADPRSNDSLISLSFSSLSLSVCLSVLVFVFAFTFFLSSLSLSIYFPLYHHTYARFMAWRYAEKDTDRLAAFYDQRHAMPRHIVVIIVIVVLVLECVSFLHSASHRGDTMHRRRGWFARGALSATYRLHRRDGRPD